MSVTGPFIVTQRQACDCEDRSDCACQDALLVVYREAFATLEDATLIAESLVDHRDDWREMRERVASLSASGGGSLTLPNGDVIEVVGGERALRAILADLGWPDDSPLDLAICAYNEKHAAWNAEHGIGLGEPCEHCDGSGSVRGVDKHGDPDDPDLSSPCSRCGGTGTAREHGIGVQEAGR